MLYRSSACEQYIYCWCRQPLTLRRSVNRILSEVATKKEHSFWKRLFSVTIDRDRIAAWGNDLDRIILLFNVCFSNVFQLLIE